MSTPPMLVSRRSSVMATSAQSARAGPARADRPGRIDQDARSPRQGDQSTPIYCWRRPRPGKARLATPRRLAATAETALLRRFGASKTGNFAIGVKCAFFSTETARAIWVEPSAGRQFGSSCHRCVDRWDLRALANPVRVPRSTSSATQWRAASRRSILPWTGLPSAKALPQVLILQRDQGHSDVFSMTGGEAGQGFRRCRNTAPWLP
jgi:hypothetical protein